MVHWRSYARPAATISSGEVEYHIGRDSWDIGWAFEPDGGWIRIQGVTTNLLRNYIKKGWTESCGSFWYQYSCRWNFYKKKMLKYTFMFRVIAKVTFESLYKLSWSSVERLWIWNTQTDRDALSVSFVLPFSFAKTLQWCTLTVIL